MKEKEEIQRTRSNYLKYGDANTRWFDSSANMRIAKNTILGLLDAHSIRCTSHEDIPEIFTPYYSDVFTSWHPSNFDAVLACIPTRVTAEMNDSLCHPYTCEEIDCALKQMHLYKLMGDGHSLNIWNDRWLPRPWTFKPMAVRSTPFENHKVSDLIDYANGCWRKSLVRCIFILCDIELILNLPLCESWPSDKIIWHYNSVCGHPEEMDTHTVLKCPMATHIWEGSGLADAPWTTKFLTLTDYNATASKTLEPDALGDFSADFVLRDHDGNVMLAGSKHTHGFGGATVEEVTACPHGLKCAHAHGCRNIIIEGNCLQLIQVLRSKSIHDSLVALCVVPLLPGGKIVDV
ncbi:LOW QUALITY PROTEIN: hypothetical protein Cgig2_023760 [Carnegiea gigantea]|uniref:RNase H type-1 domain-containing protein n=1 Tax=Carnegiea gigantea TaxID=171969 RepID=A0A9Q1KE57_9CARY|nr:LOW QUALITY PROTEIN: hypothetical protein Cgig2_023760 [Carnegiea gigantea]